MAGISIWEILYFLILVLANVNLRETSSWFSQSKQSKSAVTINVHATEKMWSKINLVRVIGFHWIRLIQTCTGVKDHLTLQETVIWSKVSVNMTSGTWSHVFLCPWMGHFFSPGHMMRLFDSGMSKANRASAASPTKVRHTPPHDIINDTAILKCNHHQDHNNISSGPSTEPCKILSEHKDNLSL